MHLSEARAQYVRWLIATRDLSPHTVRAYAGDVTAFERYAGKRMLANEIEKDSLVAFIEEQRRANLSPRSIRRRAAGLRSFCRWLVSRDMLTTDPWAGTTVSAGRSRSLPRVVPAHELDQLLTSLRVSAGLSRHISTDRPLLRPDNATTLLGVALMLATGIRVHEAVGIKCRDINLQGRSVRLVGKGRRERQVYLTNDWLAHLTDAYIQTRSALGLSHEHLLFNSRHQPLTEAAMRTRLAKASQVAGLGTPVTPHMLRHTAATQLIEAGVDIRYIQRLLGHASLSTTEIYTHVSDQALRRVVSDADILGRLQQR
jgi:site-specific recombinase XerD